MPTIGKFFEKMVNSRLQKMIERKISPCQHGFVKNRSTSTNLMEFVDFVLCNMELSNQIDALYTDFWKAFDTVDQRKLTAELRKFDLHPKVIKWIWSYLRNRKLSVKIGACFSTSFVVNTGVPQGSHLGPTLFILFINSLIEKMLNFGVRILLYADDAKSYAVVNNAIDAADFQRGINVLNDWCTENKLKLNVNKCKIMTFHRKQRPFINEYRVGDEFVERVTEIRDLGVLLDTKLVFNRHIDTIIAKSFASLGFLKRICSNMYDPYTLKSLYCAHVRSILEYACVVWQPFYQIHIDRIERIQRKFTKFALRYIDWNNENNPEPSYQSRCQLIALETLNRRRTNTSFFFFYDLLNGFIDAPHLLDLIDMNRPMRSLRSNGTEMIRIPTHRTNYGQNRPLNRVGRLFNAIDDNIRLNISRNGFRSQIKSLQVTPDLTIVQ